MQKLDKEPENDLTIKQVKCTEEEKQEKPIIKASLGLNIGGET